MRVSFTQEHFISYFITRVRITCIFSTDTSTRTKTNSFGDYHAAITSYPMWCPEESNFDDPGFNGMQ